MSVRCFLNNKVDASLLPPPIANALNESLQYESSQHTNHGNYSDQHFDEPRNSPGQYTDHANHSDSNKQGKGSK